MVGEAQQPGQDGLPIDFEVDLGPRGRYAGTAATLDQLGDVMTKWAVSGECLAGRYLWIDSLIVVSVVSAGHIAEVVNDLGRTAQLSKALRRIA